jgi:hypothetical protein
MEKELSWRGWYLDLAQSDGILVLSYARALSENLGLNIRDIEVGRLVRSRMKRLGPLVRGNAPQSLVINVSAVSRSRLKSLVMELEDVLDVIATRPFSARKTEELLGITSKERLRWTKDGRLPHSRTAPISRGHTIMLPVYSVECVVALRSSPEVILSWRETDVL